MLLYVYLLFALGLVYGQKQSFRGGNRYAPIPYYNLGPKPGNGVGVLQDLSNARILSNEPFIISFEFPKLIGSGDSRKNRFGAKSSRTKSQRKKNRKPRQFRHVVVPGEEVLERRKRLEIMRRPPPSLENLRLPNLITDDWRTGKSLLKTGDTVNPSDRTNYGRLLNFEAKDKESMETVYEEKPVPTVNALQESPQEDGGEETETDHQKNWENIKKKWISLFAKQKEGNENEVDENEERLKVLSRKMWANCQLLKLLKAPQRNPYFYKLLPPNYPALIMDEEKQLQCNEFYDITDLAKDKKMIAEKIEQLERILSSGKDVETRRKREAPEQGEEKAEEENTLQDETLQGKLEGEVRSDRSKRTKERQHIRRQRSKDAPKEKTRKISRPRTSTKESRRHHTDKQETTESSDVKRARRKDRINEVPTKKILEEDDLKPEKEATEKKREKQEIRSGKDNSLQDVFSPSEVSKVIRQKEMEANIFDKVLRAMRKFEDNNPYDESFRPQKRESGNNTEVTVVHKDETSEEGWELEDTIKKLAKIFKVLGVKAEAAKKKACTDCTESGESSSEESSEDGKRLKKSKPGKTPKCSCADCPFCQDCLKCFKECRKAALAAKTSLANNQTPVSSPQVAAGKGTNGEKYFGVAPDRSGSMGTNDDRVRAVERVNNVKLERMYRSKLPPSRDLVKVYFDNPENKLLVWTKRGRRTMPWGPLTSDLQLYRDRARQILKSAEDILHRIRETEDKIHTGQYDENEQGDSSDKTHKEKNMDDIIKKVVNEDETKNLLRTPWEAELEKGVVDGHVVQSNQVSQDFEGTTFNIFKDGIHEMAKESLTLEHDKEHHEKPFLDGGESEESYEVGRVEAAEPKLDTHSRIEETKPFTEEVSSPHHEGSTDREVDNESVEAAVLPIEKKEEEMDHLTDHDNKEDVARVKEMKESSEELKEREEEKKDEEEEDEDIPAKVEAVNQEKTTEDGGSKLKSKVKAHRESQRKKIAEYIEKKLKKHQNVRQRESEESEDEQREKSGGSENVEKSRQSDESQSMEKEVSAKVEEAKKSYSSESGAEETYAGESEEAQGSFSGESEEVEKSYSGESSVEKPYSGESHSIKGSDSVKNKGVKKGNRGESDEVERTLDGESRESGEVREVHRDESGEDRKSHQESGEVRKAHSEESGEVIKPHGAEQGKVRKTHREESGEVRESYSDDSGEVRKAYSDESEEVRKTHREESGEVKESYSDESGEGRKAYSEESGEVSKAHREESGEVSKSQGEESEEVRRTHSDESGEVRRTHNGESEVRKSNSEESGEVRRTHSDESGEVRKAYSDESEVRKSHGEESEEVRKAHSKESEVGKTYSEESEVRKSHGEESGEVRAYSDESGEEKTYSNESDSVEEAREYGSESEDVEKSAEKMIGELRKVIKQGETRRVPPKKGWQGTAEMEKKVENVMKEIKEATKIEEEKEKLLTKKRKEESEEEVEKSESEDSYDDAEQVERKESKVEEYEEEVEDRKKEIQADSLKTEMKKPEKKTEEKTIPFEDHIKSIEENYIIKGVKQTKEEKEAILKALLNVEKKEGKEGIAEESVQEVTEGQANGEEVVAKPEKAHDKEGNPLKTVVEHLGKGHMNEDDFEVIKKLDESQVDLLVGEMQKNDENGKSVNCETRMKLCQAVCSCGTNGTDTELNKYEIIKGFLGWLKDLNMEKMVPISA